MNEQLHAFVEELIRHLVKGYDYSEKKVDQIGNYHQKGEVKLIQIDVKREKVTLAFHQRGNHAHVMILDKTIEEIHPSSVPLVIFTYKQGTRPYARIQPGVLDRIVFSDFGFVAFHMFTMIQQLLFKKIRK